MVNSSANHKPSKVHHTLLCLVVLLNGVGSFLPRIAAAYGEHCFLRNAPARHAQAQGVGDLAREEAGIDLATTANTAPAHTVIVIITALNWACATLVVEQNASKVLQKSTRKWTPKL